MIFNDPANALFEKARHFYHLRRYALDLKELDTYLAIVPQDMEAYCLKALSHGHEKSEKEAREAVRHAIELAPDSSYPLYVSALVNSWFNDNNEALRVIEAALVMNPENLDILDLSSRIYAAKNRYTTALKMAERGLQLDASHTGCLLRRAAALFEMYKAEEAEVTLRQLLALDPNNAEAAGYLGKILTQQGNYKEAGTLLCQALREQPDWGIVQVAWQETLMARFRLYRWLTMMQMEGFVRRPWRTFFVVLLVVCFLVFLSYDGPIELRLIVAVFLGVLLGIVVFFGLIAVVGVSLKIISGYLLVSNRELRRSYDWGYITQAMKSDLPYLALPVAIIIVVLIVKAFF